MEQARIFIAIALSFLIFILWEVFFVDKQEIETVPQVEKIISKETQDNKEVQGYIPQIKEEILKESIDKPQDYQIRETKINTPLYTVTISEKGATFSSFILKNYKESVGEQSPFKELISEKLQEGTLQCFFQEKSIPDLNSVMYESSVAGKTIDVQDRSETIAFSWTSPEGITFIKEYAFSPTNYIISMTIRVKNGSDRDIEDQLRITLANQLEQKDAYYGFVGPSGLIDNKIKQVKIENIKKEPFTEGNIKWIGLETIYFINSIVPKEVKQAGMVLSEGDNNIVYNGYLEPVVKVEKG
ncbi:MAG: membrane protein insertase YidC, partial [Acidobacteria bacterium]|nr:membrane protein insertase YidC [Acidobacteriota bacterium]